MKIKFIPLALVLGVIMGTAQITTSENAIFYVSPNTGVYSAGDVTVNNTSKVINQGNIKVANGGTVKNTTGSAANFELRYTDAKDYGQLIIEPAAAPSGKVLMPRALVTSTSSMRNAYFGSPFDGYTVRDMEADFGLPANGLPTPCTVGVYCQQWAGIGYHAWNNDPGKLYFEPGTAVAFVPGQFYSLNKNANPAFKTAIESGATASKFTGVPHVAPATAVSIPFNQRTVNIVEGARTVPYKVRYSAFLNDPFAGPYAGQTAEQLNNAGYASNILYVANPFTSNIDITKLIEVSGLESDIVGVGYFGAVTTPPTITKNGILGQNAVLTTITAGGYNSTTKKFTTGATDKVNIIPPTTYFFVKINKDVTGKELQLNNNAIQTFTTTDFDASSTAMARKKSAFNTVSTGNVYQVNLHLLNSDKDTSYGETYIAAGNNFETGVPVINEVTDRGYVGNGTRIYTVSELATGGIDPAEENNPLYINTLNSESEKVAIPVVIETATDEPTNLVLGARLSDNGLFLKDGVVNFANPNAKFYFHDKQENVIKLIDTNFEYPITVQGQVKDRFEIFWKDSGLSSNEDDNKDVLALDYSTSVYKSGSDYKVRFDNKWKSADVAIYTAIGQLVSSQNKIDAKNDYVLPISKASSSVYIVKITGDNGEVITKKIVK